MCEEFSSCLQIRANIISGESSLANAAVHSRAVMAPDCLRAVMIHTQVGTVAVLL